jgi:hypothetical protein
MPETTESEFQSETEAESGSNVINELCDALRHVGDVSYAILPEDLAHNLGDLKKSFLSTIRSLIDKDIEWVEARVAGGDRLRQEWRQKCKSDEEPEPVN